MPRAEAGSTKAISNKIKSVCYHSSAAIDIGLDHSNRLDRKVLDVYDGTVKLASAKCAMRMVLNGMSCGVSFYS